MKTLFEKLERLFTAVTFAEAGEHETARQLAEDPPARHAPLPATRPGHVAVN